MTSRRSFVIAGVAVSAVLAASAAWVASSFPDGLEKVADKLGFGNKAAQSVHTSPVPDYILPVLGSGPWSGAVAGTAGVIAVFAAAWGMGRLLQSRKRAPRLRR